ncbi:MAG: hypothetical protein IKX26_06285 [Bacteroidales bacterium]|nr:hypothetical protein [Bacteroidales bacterium]
MKRYVCLLTLLATFFLAASCSKDEKEKQPVEFYYYLDFSYVDYPEMICPPDAGPKDLIKKVGNLLEDYAKQFYGHGYLYANERGSHYQCSVEDFEATIQKADAGFVASQQRKAQIFRDNFYKNEIEPLLQDKETYGKGEFEIKVKFTVSRIESGVYTTNKYSGGNTKPMSTFTYKPYESINGIKITNGSLADPIVVVIKYSNP